MAINIEYTFENIDTIHSILSQIINNVDANSNRTINPELSVLDLVHLIALDEEFTSVLNRVVYPQRDAIFVKYCKLTENGDPVILDGEMIFDTPEKADAANDDVKNNLSNKKTHVAINSIPKEIWAKVKNISGFAARLFAPIVVAR